MNATEKENKNDKDGKQATTMKRLTEDYTQGRRWKKAGMDKETIDEENKDPSTNLLYDIYYNINIHSTPPKKL